MERGTVCWVDIPYADVDGSKVRPAVVVSCDKTNRIANRIQVLPCSKGATDTSRQMTPIEVEGQLTNVQADRIITIHKNSIRSLIRKLTLTELEEVERCLLSQMGF
jgi:mRNA-degrading endonuclease toxin of MazEF toxin-antitoxin module